MNHVSLFTGIGGFDLGFERAGMTSTAQIEYDSYPRSVLQRHWPDVSRPSNDVKEVTGHDLGSVDILSGGFPCQDISVAGRRAGLDGERSGLWFEFARLINETRPPVVVIENVAGLLSSNGGDDMAVIVGALEQLGYVWAYRLLDSQWFGVAQRRRRVFIVGHSDAERAAAVLFEPEGGEGDPTPVREAGTDVAHAINCRTGGVSGKENQETLVAHTLTGEGHDASEDGTGRGTPLVFDCQSGGDVWIHPSDKPGAIGREGRQAVAIHENQRGELSVNDTCGALGCGGGKPGQGYPAVAIDDAAYNIHGCGSSTGGSRTDIHVTLRARAPGQSEGLGTTVVTCPATDADRMRDTPGLPRGMDARRYRQLGNAVTVSVAEWIGRRLVKVAESHA